MELQDLAQESYLQVVNSRKLRQILASRERPQHKTFALGDIIYYYRPIIPGQTSRPGWKGPATVAGVNPRTGLHFIEHGGSRICVMKDHLRDAGTLDDPDLDETPSSPKAESAQNPTDSPDTPKFSRSLSAERQTENYEIHSEKKLPRLRCRNLLKEIENFNDAPASEQENSPGNSNPGSDQGSEGEPERPRRSARLGKGRLVDPSVCFLSMAGAGDTNFTCDTDKAEKMLQSALIAQEANVYEYTFEDVSLEERTAALERAMSDYTSTGSWDENSDTTLLELEQSRRQFPNLIIFSGVWAKRAKLVDGVLKARMRWAPRGFEEDVESSVDSPTVSSVAAAVCEAVILWKQWVDFLIDFWSAFFQCNIYADGECKWLVLPPELQQGRKGQQRIARRLLREVPGTKGAPRAWFLTLLEKLYSIEFVQSKIDPCVFWLFPPGGEVLGVLPVHVDDARGGVDTRLQDDIRGRLESVVKLGKFSLGEPGKEDHLGVTYETAVDSVGNTAIFKDQIKYIEAKLVEVPLTSTRVREREDVASVQEQRLFQGAMGCFIWILKTRFDYAYIGGISASAIHRLRIKHILELNKAIRTIRANPLRIKIPQICSQLLKVVCIVDYAAGTDDMEGRSHGAIAIGIMPDTGKVEPGPFAFVYGRSRALRRVVHSSYDGETVVAVEGLDAAYPASFLLSEAMVGPKPGMLERYLRTLEGKTNEIPITRVPIEIHTDSQCLVTRVDSLKINTNMARRRIEDVADLREQISLGVLKPLIKIGGKANPLDAVTKQRALTKHTMNRLRTLLTEGYYTPIFGPHEFGAESHDAYFGGTTERINPLWQTPTSANFCCGAGRSACWCNLGPPE